MSNATVSIPLAEFMEIQQAKQKAELALAQMTEQLRQQKIAANSSTLIAFARDALEVVRFAVASMPPESTKGWPVNSLRAIAIALPTLPDATVDDNELAITLSTFANECTRYEERRRVMKTFAVQGPPDDHKLAAETD